VIGGVEMGISFVLMAHSNASNIRTVVAHPKAFGACAKNLKKMGVNLMESPSNGKAAETVSQAGPDSGLAALGPVQAAEKFGLKILARGFEDLPARTTFFLMGPRSFKIPARPSMSCMTVFRTKDQPGALVKVLLPYSEEGVNLRYIHSLHYSDGVYDFAIITEDAGSEAHVKATARASEHMNRWIRFGPFPIEAV
jgi:prephenate dehydratase